MNKILFLFPLVVLTGVISIDDAFAQNHTEPVIIKIGIELMSVGEINRETGSYDLTFWVTETADNYDFTKQPPPVIDYENGYASEISSISIEPHFYKFKVRGTFYNEIDYRPYPFQHMDLAVHIKSVIPNTLDNLVFTVDNEYSGIRDETFVTVPGWNLGEPSFSTSNQTYPWGEFSRFTAVFPVGSSPVSAFLKYLLPAIIITAFAFSTYWIPAKYSGERLRIVSATLIAAIFFHSSFLSAQIPPVSYLTLADKVMMSAYAMLGMCLLSDLIHKKNQDTLKEKYTNAQEKNLDKKFRIMTPLISVGVFLIAQFLF